MSLNATIADSGKIFLQFLGDILYFPLWWYSRGFWGVLQWAGRFLGQRLRGTGLLVWLKNWFTPMYGQHDWAGVMISFLVRGVQIVIRAFIMCFWLVYTLAAIILWLAAPVYAIYQLILQLTA
jgi:hypothetical protein